MKALKGSEKQVKFANDLIDELTARVEKFEARGKGEHFAKERQLLNAIQDGMNAGQVIEALNNQTALWYGVEKGYTTLEKFLNK